MKPGLGLYKQMLTPENFRFARQAGAQAIVAHLVDYMPGGPRIPDAKTVPHGWGVASGRGIWTVDELVDLRRAVEAEGLELAALENFEIGHWYDVLLDGPRKQEQLAGLQQLVRNVGEAGIPVIGYNFSLAAVWGHTTGPLARGGAETVRFDRAQTPPETEIPRGMVWNMIYDTDAPEGETLGEVGEDEMWSRISDFLQAVVPVAEEAGVKLAIHPDDPPLPRLRGTARIATHPGQAAARARPRAEPLEHARVLPGDDRGDAGRERLRDDRAVRRRRQDRLRPLPQRARPRARLHRGLHRRGRRRHARGAADLRPLRLRRRDRPGPHAADELRRTVARRHGVRARVHPSGPAPDRVRAA